MWLALRRIRVRVRFRVRFRVRGTCACDVLSLKPVAGESQKHPQLTLS